MSVFTKRDSWTGELKLTALGYVAAVFCLLFFFCGCHSVADILCKYLYLITDEHVTYKEIFYPAVFFVVYGAYNVFTEKDKDSIWLILFLLGLITIVIGSVIHIVSSML